MIKIYANSLFALENNNLILNKLNPELENFLNHPYKNGALKYDVQNKLRKAILKEVINIEEFRQKLVSDNPPDIPANNELINKQIYDILNSEIVIDVLPIGLSRLIEEDCSRFNFEFLDSYINDDRKSQ